MSLHIDVDISDPDRALSRIEHGPSRATVLRLDATLSAQFLQTQAFVHVQTGSLKGSGDIDSDTDPGSWEGTISYGGPAPGMVHPNVDYAEHEQSRGGEHDFMTPVYGRDDGYVDAILTHMRGQ